MVFIYNGTRPPTRLHAHYGTNTKPYLVDYKSICSSRHSEAVGHEGGDGGVSGRVSIATLIKKNI